MIVIENPKFDKAKILEWMQKCIDEMRADSKNCTTYTYNLDDRYAIHIVWRDGFSEEDCPHKEETENGVGWCPCIGIAVRDSSYFVEDWTVVPNWEDLSITNSDNVNEYTVNYVLGQYYAVYRYSFEDNGEYFISRRENNKLTCPHCGSEAIEIDWDQVYVHEAYYFDITKFRKGVCKDCDLTFDIGENHIDMRGDGAILIGTRNIKNCYKGVEIK